MVAVKVLSCVILQKGTVWVFPVLGGVEWLRRWRSVILSLSIIIGMAQATHSSRGVTVLGMDLLTPRGVLLIPARCEAADFGRLLKILEIGRAHV